MVAVVDGEAEGRLEIGTAATAGMARKFVQDDLAILARETDCGRQTG